MGSSHTSKTCRPPLRAITSTTFPRTMTSLARLRKLKIFLMETLPTAISQKERKPVPRLGIGLPLSITRMKNTQKLRWISAIYSSCARIPMRTIIARLGLGHVLTKLERYNEAETYYRKVVEVAPEDANNWNALGICLRKGGNEVQAEDCYKKALKLNDQCPNIWNNYGVTLSNLQKYEEAENAYTRALELDFNH